MRALLERECIEAPATGGLVSGLGRQLVHSTQA